MGEHAKPTVVLQCERKLVTLPAQQKRFDPDSFFKTRKGLCVWSNFHTGIVSHAKAVEEVPELNLSVFTLVSDANDAQIRSELPAGHVFTDLNVFCYHLAGMIKKQAGGTEGSLLNEGFTNIFYVQGTAEVFAVSVNWDAACREWDVTASPLRALAWLAGCRVLSAATVA